MWGIVPAAGLGSRIQPLAFSKELLPVGRRRDAGVDRPRAVSEYLVERMIRAGATKICFVISPGKSDIVEYYGGSIGPAHVCYTVQPQPVGLCDAIFRALPLLHPTETVLVGLPDTIWFPADGFCHLDDETLSFLLFPVARPELFDAVITDDAGRVREVQVKRSGAGSFWVWGAFRAPGAVLQGLHALWCDRDRRDVYLGTLVNAWLACGGEARGVRRGEAYVDVGTLDGYRGAIALLDGRNTAGFSTGLPDGRTGARLVQEGAMATAAKTTLDHEEIRRWAEARGGRPAAVAGTATGNDDPGILRIDFAGAAGDERLVGIDWNTFFGKFEDAALAFVYQEHTADGGLSRFFKLERREEDDRARERDRERARRPESGV